MLSKNQYKTIWEIKQKWVLMNALARAPFVDQTQSMNIFMGVPDYKNFIFLSHVVLEKWIENRNVLSQI